MLGKVGQFAKHVLAPRHYGDSKWTPAMGSFYDLKAKNIDGVEEPLTKHSRKVALVINVACLCGYTNNGYQFLAKMQNKYADKGFTVLAFPCNQFGGQEPGTEQEIKDYVKRFDVKFPMFSKIDVNGPNTHPVYQFLKTCFPGDITWNFASSFIVNREGVPIKRFGKESYDEIEKFVEEEIEREHAAIDGNSSTQQ